MPSTILNIWDILQNWKSVTKMNEDISWLYICYQVETNTMLYNNVFICWITYFSSGSWLVHSSGPPESTWP